MSPTAATARSANRWARAAVWAAACLILSIGMHATAGGSWSTPGAIAAAVVAAALAVAVTQRIRGTVAIAASLIGGQVLIHVLLSVVHGGHGAGTGLVPEARMVMAHGFAAVVLAAGLDGCDGLWRAWLALLAALSRAVPALTPVPVGAACATPEPTPVPLGTIRLGSVSRRGPPAP